jgi:hypothetical protein
VLGSIGGTQQLVGESKADFCNIRSDKPVTERCQVSRALLRHLQTAPAVAHSIVSVQTERSKTGQHLSWLENIVDIEDIEDGAH